MRTLAITLVALAWGCTSEPTMSSETDDGTTGQGGTSTPTTTGGSSGVGDDSTGTAQLPSRLAFGSGTRLQAVVSQSPAGEETLHHWFDTELEIDCAVAYDEAGDIRCLPLHPASLAFADASCSIPAIRNAECFEPDEIVTAAQRQCEDRPGARVLQLREPIENVFDQDALGNCTPDMASMGAANRALRVDVDSYALATSSIEAEGTDLARMVIEFDDGAWAWVSPFDNGRATECDLWTIGGQSVCIPRFRADVAPTVFAGSNCGGNPVGLDVVPEECSTPAVARDAGPTSVVLALADGVWDVGDPVTELFSNPDDLGCNPIEPAAGLTYFELTPASAGSFPAASTIEMGEGRFLPQFLADADGTVVSTHAGLLAPQRWQDTELGFACTVEQLSTGSFGCVPTPKVRTTWFADDACTVPVVDEQPTVLSGGPMVLSDWISLVEPACDGQLPVYAVATIGALHEGPVFRLLEDGTCQPDGLPAPHLLATLTPAEQLETFEVVTLE